MTDQVKTRIATRPLKGEDFLDCRTASAGDFSAFDRTAQRPVQGSAALLKADG
jgi:hypothetical protein